MKIKEKDIIGSIVDITAGKNGETVYVVESLDNTPANDPDAYPGEWPIYDCVAEDLQKIP